MRASLFFLLSLFIVFCVPVPASAATGASITAPDADLTPSEVRTVQAQLASAALATAPQEAPQEPSTSIPELTAAETWRRAVQAFSDKSWGLFASLAVVGLVLLLRKVGSKLWPFLGTAKGAVVLSALGGTATLTAIALGQGQPLSVGMLISCMMTAAGASGLFSWGQTVLQHKATLNAVCTPEEIANRQCRV